VSHDASRLNSLAALLLLLMLCQPQLLASGEVQLKDSKLHWQADAN
jgi:hypothetical protein